jgi:hypothetical protein
MKNRCTGPNPERRRGSSSEKHGSKRAITGPAPGKAAQRALPLWNQKLVPFRSAGEPTRRLESR